MNTQEFLNSLLQATTSNAVHELVGKFLAAHKEQARWVPLGGRENNRGIIEVGGDPGRSLVERVTNAIDAVLELNHAQHSGIPECASPREAAHAWLGIPTEGLHKLSQAQRRDLARRVKITVHEGDSPQRRTIDILDAGIGLSRQQMPKTILSLNESNKMQKFYLAGAYGQGGSSTYVASTFTLVASRPFPGAGQPVAFTLVKYENLPADKFKHGRYVYLTMDALPLETTLDEESFPFGTLVRHIGYDLSSYKSPVGPNSIYGLLNETLFDPVVPIWLDDRPHNNRRVIKGSRNALNGAVDEGDERTRGPEIAHPVPLHYVRLGDYGSLGIEYWVLSPSPEKKDDKEKDEKQKKRKAKPNESFVNSARPIVLTHNGQTHGTLPASVIRKDAELSFLATRIVVHLDCNSLTPDAKRNLFVSNREDVRTGEMLRIIREELVRTLRSDEELARLNSEAEQEGLREHDEEAEKQTRIEVARLLKSMGFATAEPLGGAGGDGALKPTRPVRPRPPRPPVEPIPIVDPPTFVEFAGDGPVKLYPGQRRYLRVRTNAPSTYHSPNDPSRSQFNLIAPSQLKQGGSTPLIGGRLRFILDAQDDAKVGDKGTIALELRRSGQEALRATKEFEIVAEPEPAPSGAQISLPTFIFKAIKPEDDDWTRLDWPANVNDVASEAEPSQGKLVIYYSEEYPAFRQAKARFMQKGAPLATSFELRYRVWLAAHSLLLIEDQKKPTPSTQTAPELTPPIAEDDERASLAERQERCRLAKLAAMFAAQEVQLKLSEMAATGEA